MTARDYRPVLPCSNKVLKKKWDDTYYQEHLKRVRTIKPAVDTKSPPIHSHVVQKQKKKQLEEERAEIIDRDNMTLLRKMQGIMGSSNKGIDHRNTYQHHSLNDLKRQRELERVQRENQAILQRLQEVKPMYRVSDHVESWRRNAELTEMITAYPEQKTLIKTSKTKHSSSVSPAEPKVILASSDEKPEHSTSNDDSISGVDSAETTKQ